MLIKIPRLQCRQTSRRTTPYQGAAAPQHWELPAPGWVGSASTFTSYTGRAGGSIPLQSLQDCPEFADPQLYLLWLEGPVLLRQEGSLPTEFSRILWPCDASWQGPAVPAAPCATAPPWCILRGRISPLMVLAAMLIVPTASSHVTSLLG